MQQFQMISIYAYKMPARKVYLAICSYSIDEGYYWDCFDRVLLNFG